MHLVHVGRDNHEPQEALKIPIHFDISVFHLRVETGKDQIDDDNPEGNAEDSDRRPVSAANG